MCWKNGLQIYTVYIYIFLESGLTTACLLWCFLQLQLLKISAKQRAMFVDTSKNKMNPKILTKQISYIIHVYYKITAVFVRVILDKYLQWINMNQLNPWGTPGISPGGHPQSVGRCLAPKPSRRHRGHKGVLGPTGAKLEDRGLEVWTARIGKHKKVMWNSKWHTFYKYRRNKLIVCKMSYNR